MARVTPAYNNDPFSGAKKFSDTITDISINRDDEDEIRIGDILTLSLDVDNQTGLLSLAEIFQPSFKNFFKNIF